MIFHDSLRFHEISDAVARERLFSKIHTVLFSKIYTVQKVLVVFFYPDIGGYEVYYFPPAESIVNGH